jgi:hypothetical protein
MPHSNPARSASTEAATMHCGNDVVHTAGNGPITALIHGHAVRTTSSGATVSTTPTRLAKHAWEWQSREAWSATLCHHATHGTPRPPLHHTSITN